MIAPITCGVWTRAFSGHPSAVGEARGWLAGLLDGLPVASDAVLVLSELATNALRHTASSGCGFSVSVEVRISHVCLQVREAYAKRSLKK
ncbi:MAG: ATP-binding protein [Carbonactinosporaceae bacterium]